jgi:CheY-like chemotaxis protein
MILRQAGYKTLLAPNASRALEMLRRQQVECVLMDYHLPDAGEQFGPQVRALCPDTPIIVLSGDPEAAAATTFANLLVAKPVAPRALLDRIAELMTDRSLDKAA